MYSICASRTYVSESNAMLDPRACKDAAWAEVAHIPLEEAFLERIPAATESAGRLGFTLISATRVRPAP